MARFQMHLHTKIAGIPAVGIPKQFEVDEVYETETRGEILILQAQPGFVVTKLPDENESPASQELEIASAETSKDSEDTEEEAPSELDGAKAERAHKDELLLTPLQELRAKYPNVWRVGMTKPDFVELILEQEEDVLEQEEDE